MLFDMMDKATAESLGVSLEEYIKAIESMTPEQAEEILNYLWNPSIEMDEFKAKELFNKYKNNKKKDD